MVIKMNILITGARSNIGYSIAKLLAKRGHIVYAGCKTKEEVIKVLENFKTKKPFIESHASWPVYMSTIIGRFLAADNSTELRESVTRDYFGFLNWLVFGGFAAKGVANMLDKKTENLFNISKEGRGIKHWLNDMSLKTHNEIAARGKEFAKKNLWKLNAAHLGGLAYSFITLGLVLPMINDKMTKYKARKNANAKPETQT